MNARPILIAGPTASGKSALAVALAERLKGAVINADSQQVWREWRILTARPSAADEARAPHFLYGHVPVTTAYSVGAWLGEVEGALTACRARGLRPIIVGGTGLYFAALTEGLAPIPPVPAEVRARAEALLAELGVEGFAARLAARDPETAARIDRANPARLLRAFEVIEATGVPLAEWQRRTPPPVVPLAEAVPIALTPPPDWLARRIAARFEEMLAEGVLEEVRAVMALDLPPRAPGLKVHGARELMAHLRGEMDLAEAGRRVVTVTRQYAKRQMTWIRNRMLPWQRLSGHDFAELVARATEFVREAG